MRACLRTVARLGVAIGLSASIAVAQPASARLEGRRLEDVLRAFQATGLRIVFSSQIVARDMRVLAEPRASDPRRQLDEVLAPHGLVAIPGPAGVILVVRDRRGGRVGRTVRSGSSPTEPRQEQSEASLAGNPKYTERVTVTAARDEVWARDAGSGITLDGRELVALGRGLVDDPLRTLQAAPHVAAGDDFRSEFSVRASPYRHTGIVIDGVDTPWLRHAAPGRDAGTVTMLGSEVIEQATLQAGAYPRRHGDRLGAQVEFVLRDGSRDAPHFRAMVNGTMAGGTGEGPLGADARGAWLLALRRSYLEWPVSRTDHGATVFGFSDALARVVYDVRPTEQFSVSLVAGESSLERDDQNPAALGGGSNRSALFSIGWRSLVGTGMVVQQRVATVVHDFRNVNQARAPVGAGENSAVLYRADAVRVVSGGVLETGVHVERRRALRRGIADGPGGDGSLVVDWGPDVAFGAWTTAAFAHYRWSASRLTLAPGFRVTTSTLVERPFLDRWLETGWKLGPKWSLSGSVGLVHQLPDLDHFPARNAGLSLDRVALRPERALHIDVGIRHEAAANVVWRVTAFSRAEDDILQPHESARAAAVVPDEVTVAHPVGVENALSGLARGVEVSIERRGRTGFGGWLGYAFGCARYTDPRRHETFWADFDQRHGLNAAALYRQRNGLSFGAMFKAGTNVPIPGYLSTHDGALHAGPDRNRVRLPPYARLDLRAERTLVGGNRTVTLFAEVVNALDRTNLGLAAGFVTPAGNAVGFTQRLYPRLFSGGVRVEF